MGIVRPEAIHKLPIWIARANLVLIRVTFFLVYLWQYEKKKLKIKIIKHLIKNF